MAQKQILYQKTGKGFEMNIKKIFFNSFRKINSFYRLSDKKYVSDIMIDIIIPTCSKDYRTLAMTIDSVRKNVRHPIDKIMIVAPRGDLEKFCEEQNLVFIDENIVLPITVRDINYNPNGINRSGWIFQQLLKLNSDTLTDKEYFLIVDSDTVFSRPQTFINKNGKMLLNCSDEYHKPYFDTYKKLIPLDKRYKKSFVCHHMLFSVKYLRELKKVIENNTGMIWWRAILSNLDNNECSCFSEYETYGNYMFFYHNDKIYLRYWYNKAVLLKDFDKIKHKDAYKSISMHAYLQ